MFIVLSSWLKVIARVHSVHLMNVVRRQMAAIPQTKPVDWLVCMYAFNGHYPNIGTCNMSGPAMFCASPVVSWHCSLYALSVVAIITRWLANILRLARLSNRWSCCQQQMWCTLCGTSSLYRWWIESMGEHPRITAEVCSWTSNNISSDWGARLWPSSHDCHNRLRGAVWIQTWQLSAVLTVVYRERTRAIACCWISRIYNVSWVYPSIGWWHCLVDITDTDCISWCRVGDSGYIYQSADSVAVSDDSMSVEAASLSDVTGSDTPLH